MRIRVIRRLAESPPRTPRARARAKERVDCGLRNGRDILTVGRASESERKEKSEDFNARERQSLGKFYNANPCFEEELHRAASAR